jgi:hypothetical protein
MIVAKSPAPADVRRWLRSDSLTVAPSATSASSDWAASPGSISHVRRTAGSRRSTSPNASRRAAVSTTMASAPESFSIHSDLLGGGGLRTPGPGPRPRPRARSRPRPLVARARQEGDRSPSPIPAAMKPLASAATSSRNWRAVDVQPRASGRRPDRSGAGRLAPHDNLSRILLRPLEDGVGQARGAGTSTTTGVLYSRICASWAGPALAGRACGRPGPGPVTG